MRINHDFASLRKTSAKKMIEPSGKSLRGCTCDNCKEARVNYKPEPNPYVGESFEDYYKRTEPGRVSVLRRMHGARELEKKEAHEVAEKRRIAREQ